MPEDLGDGLYLTLVGMGLVFLSLVVFMLTLLALQRLFPSEEVAEVIETDEDPVAAAITDYDPVAAAIREAEADEDPAIEEQAPARLQEHTEALGSPTNGRISGAKVAAIAVATYLAMEQEERGVAQPPVVPSAWAPNQDHSGWSILGRASLWGNQGRRPQSYDQRSQSAYPPRSRLRG